MKTISRYIMTLALLLTAASGAWAQDNRFFLEVSGTSATLKWGEPISNDNPSLSPGSSWKYQGNDWTDKSGITTITVDASCTNCSKENISALFYNFVDLQTINNIENIKTDAVKYLGSMFHNCTSLQTLDLSSWNTENVTSMNGMFRGCTSLQTLDLSSFNTGKVNGMSYMFKDCSTLTTIYVGDGWSTDQLTSSSSSTEMFDGCVSLPNWDNASPVIDKTNAHTNAGGYLTYKAPAAPEPDVEVTTNAAEEGATFTEATFAMPAFDATADYELVRDMSIQMTAQVGDGTQEQPRYRVKKDGDNKFIPADMEMAAVPALFTVNDAIEQKALTQTQDYIVQIYAIDAEGQPTGDPMTFATFTFEPGIYAVKAVAAQGSDYDGETALSNTFKLFQGYEVQVAAKEFITYYKDEPLYADTETSADAELYTIQSVSADQATLSAAIETAPSLTPLLIFNNSDQAKTFLLIPANEEPNLQLTVAPEFQGTLTGTTIAASTEGTTNYALNGKAFVFVKNALEVGPNKAWLSVNTGEPSARITLVFDETTGVSEKGIVNSEKFATATWYDLNGRKVAAPSKKGIYIMNGKKVVVK